MSFDIQTQLTKLHRPIRWTAEAMTATPGLWGWIDNQGMINPVVDVVFPAIQPQVLKPIFGAVGSNRYQTHDSRLSRRIATVEGIFRAKCDSDCYQVYDCQAVPVAITYVKGMELTVACRVGVATTDPYCSAAADLGKLKPAQAGDVVVAVYEGMDFNRFCYSTVTPYLHDGVDPIPRMFGTGSELLPHILSSGSGTWLPFDIGTGSSSIPKIEIDGVGVWTPFNINSGAVVMPNVSGSGAGTKISILNGSGGINVPVVIGAGVGDRSVPIPSAPDRGAYEY